MKLRNFKQNDVGFYFKCVYIFVLAFLWTRSIQLSDAIYKIRFEDLLTLFNWFQFSDYTFVLHPVENKLNEIQNPNLYIGVIPLFFALTSLNRLNRHFNKLLLILVPSLFILAFIFQSKILLIFFMYAYIATALFNLWRWIEKPQFFDSIVSILCVFVYLWIIKDYDPLRLQFFTKNSTQLIIPIVFMTTMFTSRWLVFNYAKKLDKFFVIFACLSIPIMHFVINFYGIAVI